MSQQPDQVSVETRVLVVVGTAYFLGIITFLLVSLASVLSGSTRISATFLIGTFALSISIVYFIRTYRLLHPLLQVLWHRSSLYTQKDILPPKKMWEELKVEFSNSLRLERQLIYLPSEKNLALLYSLVAVLGGLLVQFLLLRMLSTPENLEYAVEILKDGHSFSLLVSSLSLINPIIGAAVILVSLLGASGEATAILVAIVGIPAIAVVPGMWNGIALLEVLQYDLIRGVERKIKHEPRILELLEEWLDKDIEEIYRLARALTLLLYVGVLFITLLLSAIPLGLTTIEAPL